MYEIRRFVDRVAVVTGGARGIGRGCCLRFAQEGARVAVLDVLDDQAAVTATECERLSGQAAMALTCDVTAKDSVDGAVQAIMDAWGRIDVLVAAAGIYSGQPLADVPVSDWQHVIDVDLTGVFLCNQAVAPTLMSQRSGSIVNLSSQAGKISWPANAQYSAAKTGVIGLTRSVAMELAPYGCSANAVCPGQILTDMVQLVATTVGGRAGMSPEEWLAAQADACPMKRVGTVEDIAGVVAFLASEDAVYITGQAIAVDGGMVLS